MPSITQLEYILAVHKNGHFGRASTDLGVSQPTLSAQIQKAESELGVTLFDRQSKPIVPTEHGAKLLELARAVVSAHENLLATASGKFSELAGSYSLGIIPTLASYVLPWFLAKFAERYPRVQLSVHERPTDEILTEIAANRMDAAILATPLGEPSISEHVLFYDPFYLYSHPEEEILKKETIRVGDIDSSKLWLLEDGHCFRAQVINLCGIGKRTLLPSVQFAGGSFETLRLLIDASGGYTLVPETYARTLPRSPRQRLIRPFEGGTPTREVSLIHHRSSWKTDVHRALAGLVVETLPRYLHTEIDESEIVPIRAS